MEYKSSYDRINNISDIDYISRKICKDYCFGEYTGYQLIEIGYEDFNYILYSSRIPLEISLYHLYQRNVFFVNTNNSIHFLFFLM